MGEGFSIGERKNAIDYYLIQNYFPFNLKICCGKIWTRKKCTGVNTILNKYKVKERSQGSTQTNHLTFYQASNTPIKILDSPGFDNEKILKMKYKNLYNTLKQ